LLGGVLDVGDFKFAGVDDKPAVLGDLDALDGEPFLAQATDGALEIGATEIWWNARHATESSPWFALGLESSVVNRISYLSAPVLFSSTGIVVRIGFIHGQGARQRLGEVSMIEPV
jgi:hypothetical protein